MPDPQRGSTGAPDGSDESGAFPHQDAMFNNLVVRSLNITAQAPYVQAAPGSAGFFASNPPTAPNGKALGKGGLWYDPIAYGPVDLLGATDSGASVMLAHNAARDAGGGVVFIVPGVWLIITATGMGVSGSNVTWRGAGMFVSILRQSITSGSAAAIVAASSSSSFTGNLAFEDLWFDWQKGVGGDTRVGNCAALSLSSCKNFAVRRCRFTRGPAQYVNASPAAEGLVEGNLFEDFGQPTTLAVSMDVGSSRVKIRFNRFRYVKQGVQLTGGVSPATPIDLVDITDNDFDLGWDTMVQLSGNSGGTVTYTNTALTDTTNPFAGLATNGTQWLRVMPVLNTNSGGTVTYDALTLTDTAAPFNTATYLPGDIVRAGAIFGIIKSCNSTSGITVEEWLSDTDRTFSLPPAAGASYTVYHKLLMQINAFTAGTITTTLFQGIFDRNFGSVTPSAGTRYELLPVVGSYPIYISGYCRDVGIVRNRVIRGYGDGIEMGVSSTRCTLTDNFVADGRDSGIFLQGTNHVCKGNTVLHMGKIGIGHNGSDFQVSENHCFDSGWIGPGGADFYFGASVRAIVQNNHAERLTLSGTNYKDGYLLDSLVNDGNVFIGNVGLNHVNGDFRISGSTSTNTKARFNVATAFDATWSGLEVQAPAPLTGQVGAVASVATCTTPNDGAKHGYRVEMTGTITTHGTEAINLQCAYTDDNGTARTLTIPIFTDAGAMVTAANALGEWVGFAPISCNPNTAVTLKTAGTFTGGVVYNVSGRIEPVR